MFIKSVLDLIGIGLIGIFAIAILLIIGYLFKNIRLKAKDFEVSAEKNTKEPEKQVEVVKEIAKQESTKEPEEIKKSLEKSEIMLTIIKVIQKFEEIMNTTTEYIDKQMNYVDDKLEIFKNNSTIIYKESSKLDTTKILENDFYKIIKLYTNSLVSLYRQQFRKIIKQNKLAEKSDVEYENFKEEKIEYFTSLTIQHAEDYYIDMMPEANEELIKKFNSLLRVTLIETLNELKRLSFEKTNKIKILREEMDQIGNKIFEMENVK